MACAVWRWYNTSRLERIQSMVTKRRLKRTRSRCLQPSVVHACSITRLPHKACTLHTHHHVTCSFTSHASRELNEFWAQCANSSRLPICSRPPTTASSTTAPHSLKHSGSLGFAVRLSRALRHQGITPPDSKKHLFPAQCAGRFHPRNHTVLQPVTWPLPTHPRQLD